MSLLAIEAVGRNFGGLKALQGVSFEVPEGGTFGVMGANGAGKTTLFGVISGFIKPSTGSVTFQDKDITNLPPYRRCIAGIGRTFQITKPFPELTVRQTVRIGVLLRTKSMAEATHKADVILERFGLMAHAERLGHQLAVMDRKRLEIARAYATAPKLLLLDEVAAGLRPAEVDKLVELIDSVASEGVTVLMIEHVLPAIFSLAKRVVVLDHGQLIAQGTPSEILKDQHVIEAYLGAGYGTA